jgi:hypothetical protein
MKKILLVLACGATTFVSCENKQTTPMTENEINAKVDSLVGVKIEELNVQAMEDFDRRKTIEVKAKADSIVEAYKLSK